MMNASVDIMVIGLFAFALTMVLMMMTGFMLILMQGRSKTPPPISETPLEAIHNGLTRLVTEADWLEGDRLTMAVRAVARAKEAVEDASKACGRSSAGYQIPQPLARALEESVEMLRGSSTVIVFGCECGKEVTAMLQFPKVGGRPETTDPVAISARADWREQGFSVSTACKRCQKLLKKKFLYDSPE